MYVRYIRCMVGRRIKNTWIHSRRDLRGKMMASFSCIDTCDFLFGTLLTRSLAVTFDFPGTTCITRDFRTRSRFVGHIGHARPIAVLVGVPPGHHCAEISDGRIYTGMA